MPKNSVLEYVILNPRQEINLSLFEGEKYESAIILQQLIGTLVYYSNFGQYEPRLAESWENNGLSWRFKLRKNLFAENNESITTESFKNSIERSLHIFEKKGDIPVLSSLVGYDKFIEKNRDTQDILKLYPLEGLTVEGEYLVFRFNKKIKSGLLEILSFSPFGYISSENFDVNGQWRDNTRFISSGPYKVISLRIGYEYILTRNTNWPDFMDGSPSEIRFSHEEKNIGSKNHTVIDAFTNEYQNKTFKRYNLTPEYLNSVLLGNLQTGYFKNITQRKYFKKIFHEQCRKFLPETFGSNIRSNTFYPNQFQKMAILNEPIFNHKPPDEPILIEGDIPEKNTSRWYAWQVLRETLDHLQIPYIFAKNEATFEEITNLKYDIRIRGSSIGSKIEPWGIHVIFCSSMGINLPDPGEHILRLTEMYENDEVTYAEFCDQFLEHVQDQSAIIPVSHFGVQLFISDGVDAKTFSPQLAIMKLDQININKPES